MVEVLVGILSLSWVIIQVAVGVGFVIFVHELGHFVVAKLCGVKCEKFYLGFDIGGWKFFRFRRGETEYGIGILPLGGYVKMLGQVDNPARLREEIERAKIQQSEEEASGAGAADASSASGEEAAVPIDVATAEQALYDPRSYLAKNVPQRMAIISAGVIMNVIFAFLVAVWAFGLGVHKEICAVGEVIPGDAAWQAGLRPGDRFLKIAGQKVKYFKDLQSHITVGDIDQGVPIVIRRPGVEPPLHFVLHPNRDDLAPQIGVLSLRSMTLSQREKPPYLPGSAASRAIPPLQCGDRIVMIDGQKIEDYAQLQTVLADGSDKELHLTLETTSNADSGLPKTINLVEATVPSQPMRDLGLVMQLGEITAVQNNSPAKAAGVRAKDRIVKIDDRPPEDPMRLPDWFRRRENQTIKLTLQRKGVAKPVEVTVQLRHAPWLEDLQDIPKERSPKSIPQLGIAYKVLNRVERILPGSPAEKPAEKAGITPGMILVKATIKQPTKEQLCGEEISAGKGLYDTYEFGDEATSWPVFFTILQLVHPLSTVELTFADETKATLALREADDWNYPHRGWVLESETVLCKADSFGEAVRLAAEETSDALLLVIKILRRLGTQISPKALGGPVTIFAVAGRFAQQGTAKFLLFLTLLSANLAVLNILPIPVLDGGHLVFLAYEGIRGKPADERIQVILSVVGLIFLLGLMLFVISLDIWRFCF